MKISKAIFVTGLSLLFLLESVGVIFAQDEESFVRRAVISRQDAILLSVVFPGLGQMTAGQRYKGISLFLAETASLLFSINAHENYQTKQKVYNRDLEIFNNIGSKGSGEYSEALMVYDDLKKRSNELDDLHKIRNTTLIIAGIVYAYNIVDSVFFSPSTGESQRADSGNSKITVSSALIDRNPGILLSKSF